MKFALELSDEFGPSGQEERVAALIKKELSGASLSFVSDPLGSLIAEKIGRSKGPGIILSAHMDEVGFMISHIHEDGTLSFRIIGGIDKRVLPGKTVVIGDGRVKGVIMVPPVHLSKGDDPYEAEDLRMFIGAGCLEEASERVGVGDCAVFATKACRTGERLMGKAWDDRIGCFVLTEILKKNWDINITGIFTVQEEVGLRGIQTALHHVKGEFGFAVEGTTSYEIPAEPEVSPSTWLSKGPAITAMDRASIGSPSLKKLLEEVAKKGNIPFQYKKTATGGTETKFLQQNRTGMQAICLSVPVRYIHSPAGICSEDDVKNTVLLLEKTMRLLEAKLKKVYGG